MYWVQYFHYGYVVVKWQVVVGWDVGVVLWDVVCGWVGFECDFVVFAYVGVHQWCVLVVQVCEQIQQWLFVVVECDVVEVVEYVWFVQVLEFCIDLVVVEYECCVGCGGLYCMCDLKCVVDVVGKWCGDRDDVGCVFCDEFVREFVECCVHECGFVAFECGVQGIERWCARGELFVVVCEFEVWIDVVVLNVGEIVDVEVREIACLFGGVECVERGVELFVECAMFGWMQVGEVWVFWQECVADDVQCEVWVVALQEMNCGFDCVDVMVGVCEEVCD